MEEAEHRLSEILGRADKLGVPVSGLRAARRLVGRGRGRGRAAAAPAPAPAPGWQPALPALAGALAVTLALGYCLGLHTHLGFSRAWLKWHQRDLYTQMCTISMPDHLTKAFRPPEDCSMCRGLTHVDKVSKITPTVFEEKYAYSGRPVVVTDATDSWTAPKVFTFQFFKDVYEQSLDHWSLPSSCQFFPYETEFSHLRDVFNMSAARAHMKDGTKPWYIGWSNCDDRVARILRQHYSKPYFLPSTAEGKKIDWIFMGSPGYGAHMHVDNVDHPSWQAQLCGRKKWILDPPPECYYQCSRMEVTVEPGEIIVLDTNRWYHQTTIVSDGMSITIGAEYD